MNPKHDTADVEERLANLLAEALERQDRGEAVDLTQLCVAAPELEPALAEALSHRQELRTWHRTTAAQAPAHGQILAGRYRLDDLLGQGASGAVYRAFDLQLGRAVAVKLLQAGTWASPATRQRFQREAQVLAAHEHPHVVRIYDQGQSEDSSPFLVTELLQGVSLQAMLETAQAAMPQGPSAAACADAPWLAALLPAAALERSYLRQSVRWVAELAAGLASAHAHGVCHRDVKPSNAFVRDDGRAVLLDFGIAVRPDDPSATLQDAVVGTPSYMAPEQAAGRAAPTPTLDVYGLCATLYHLLTLQPPHPGDLATALAAARTTDPVPAARLHRGLPRDLQAILDRGLERAPERRYPTATALAADLQAFLDHRPVAARPIGRLGRLLRAARRQPARALAATFGTAALLGFGFLLPLAQTLRSHQRATERAELFARLPADLCIEGQPDERLLVPLAERSVVLGELDRLLEIAPDDALVRLLRAAERRDAGDHAAAEADLQALRKLGDSPYLQAIAGAKTTDDATAFPEPQTDLDAFAAGFLAMRRHDFESAFELLTRCAHFVPARDLRLLAWCGRKQPEPEALLAEAGWLEGHCGRPTARTRHAMTVAMLLLRRYEAAIAYAEESLRLRPDRHGPYTNLGLACLRSGDLDRAQQCYERAVALRPWFANSLSGLAQTLRARGDFTGAQAAAERIRDDCWRAHELGNLAVAQALVATAARDDAERIRHAAAAVAWFDQALAAADASTRNPRRRSLPSARAHAVALGSPDRQTAVRAFAYQLQSDPLQPQQLANLALVLAESGPDPELLPAWIGLLLEQAAALAPADPRLRKARDEHRRAQQVR